MNLKDFKQELLKDPKYAKYSEAYDEGWNDCKELLDKILCRNLLEFANTPLDKRGNGWDWLSKVKKELLDLLLDN